VSRRQSQIVLWGSGGVLAAVVAALVIVQTGWFKNEVRLKIISTVENASGGRVEIKAFDYNWKALTATLHGFILHGSEPADGPPLFRADQVKVGLKIVSFFKRDVDIESLLVDRPETYVLVRPDGTTDFPALRVKPKAPGQWPEQLLKLAIGHFEWRDGSVQVDQQRVALDVRGEHLSADIRYDALTPSYRGTFSSQRFTMKSNYSLPFPAAVAATFQFARNRLDVPNFSVSLPRSRVEGSAVLSDFANVIATAQVTARIDGSEAGRMLKHTQLQRGDLTVEGNATYSNGKYAFSGSLTGTGIGYDTRLVKVADASVRCGLIVDSEGLSLPRLTARAFGASAAGEAKLLRYRDFQFQGKISGLNVREVGRLLARPHLAWDGVAAGPVDVKGRFEKRGPEDFTIRSAVEISPGKNGIPISGNARLRYQQRGDILHFDQTHLILPNSIVDVSGTLGNVLEVAVRTTNLDDAEPATALFTADRKPVALPVRLDQGHFSFTGLVSGALRNPRITGHGSADRVRYAGQLLEKAAADVELDGRQIVLTNASASARGAAASGSARIGLSDWHWEQDQPLEARFSFKSDDLALLASELHVDSRLPIRGGATFSGNLSGSYENLQGAGRLRGTGLDANGQLIDSVSADVRFAGDQVLIEHGFIRAAEAAARFSGGYRRSAALWTEGRLQAKFDTRGFQLGHLLLAQAFVPGMNANVETHFEAAVLVNGSHFALDSVDGSAQLKNITVARIPYGQLSVTAKTEHRVATATFSGDLRDSRLGGGIKVELAGDYRAQGDLRLSAIRFSTIKALVPGLENMFLPVEGVLEGSGNFAGPLANPEAITASARVTNLQLTPELGGAAATVKLDNLTLRNATPIEVTYKDKTTTVSPFQMTAKDTSVNAAGKFSLNSDSPLDFHVNGNVNLQLLRMFDPSWTSSGTSRLDATATGSLRNPSVNGTLEIRDGAFYLTDFSNGIDHANGVVRFDRNRATIQNLSAQSGGGTLSLTGFVGFGSGAPLLYHLDAAAQGVRVRYSGVSSTFNANLKYTGTSQSSMLAGDVTVMKAAFTPNTDVGSLFAATAAPVATPRAENERLHRIRLEINVVSSPTLQLTTSLSQDVTADIDLRLRGTPDRPAVLGRFSLNEGQIQFFGNKYTINRGEVNFYNPLKIEPVLDLDLETQARGITVTINITGTLEKLNVNYRSDPPLQSREIIALLATGRTPDQISASPGGQTTNQNGVLAGPNTILGSAMSPVSSRLQRFFGVTHLKIDPMLQGIENVPQARLTLEQQISRQITITYVTNLSRTAEQIFRFEWALSREYSLIAIRDENGLFGVDVQYKRRFK
jgi:translocation and assembly module TamB